MTARLSQLRRIPLKCSECQRHESVWRPSTHAHDTFLYSFFVDAGRVPVHTIEHVESNLSDLVVLEEQSRGLFRNVSDQTDCLRSALSAMACLRKLRKAMRRCLIYLFSLRSCLIYNAASTSTTRSRGTRSSLDVSASMVTGFFLSARHSDAPRLTRGCLSRRRLTRAGQQEAKAGQCKSLSE